MNDHEFRKHVWNAQTMLKNCVDAYGPALIQGRLRSWAAMTSAIVELLAARDVAADVSKPRRSIFDPGEFEPRGPVNDLPAV